MGNKESIRMMINLKSFALDNGILGYDGFQRVYILLQPYNIGVLGKDAVYSKIRDLQNAIEGIGTLEILCLGSTQSYDPNIQYLKQRLEVETSPMIRRLLNEDIEHFNSLSVSMSTSREFMLVVRFIRQDEDSIRSKLLQYLQLLKERGFNASVATKQELMKIFAVYWGQDIYTTKFFDFDGQQYLQEAK